MPGGRLTRQDRQHIAAGLTDGLTYAQIARGLGRPTSTVTREIARNGGPAHYRPYQAQQATERRARRRTASRPAAAPDDLRTPGRDPVAVHELEEHLASLMVGTGLPRMAARVLAGLYLTDAGSLTARDLVSRLRVSPAAVSKAVRDLERLELVRRERDPGRRRDRYVIDDDVWYRAWLASARMNDAIAEAAQHGAATLGAGTPAGARLQGMGQFLRHLGTDMTKAAEHWREVFTAARSQPSDGGEVPPDAPSR